VGSKLKGFVIPPKVIKCSPFFTKSVVLNLMKFLVGRIPSPLVQSIIGALRLSSPFPIQELPVHAGSFEVVHIVVSLTFNGSELSILEIQEHPWPKVSCLLLYSSF